MERIHDEDGQIFVNEITEQVVRVVSGGFQACFYFRHIWRDGLNSGKKTIKSIPVMDSKNQKKDFANPNS